MRKWLAAGMMFGLAAASAAASVQTVPPPPRQPLFDDYEGVTLRRFASAEEFDRYLAELRRRQSRRPPAAVAPETGASGIVVQGEDLALSGATNVEQVLHTLPQVIPANPEITNNQTVGVDEGGIVKQVGHFLVVLQDGRLFTADLGISAGGPLRLADRIDVYRQRDTAADWYDEMLVSGNRILVTAYDYEEEASEISVFSIDDAGRLSREGRYLLSSSDYYSTENYATRLVGDNLIFYAPHPLWRMAEGGSAAWPRLRRAENRREPDAGRQLIGPTEVYAPLGEIDYPVVHTLSVCPLRSEMECRTSAFIGASMREVYVSPTDAFLWLGAPDGLPWSIEYGNDRRHRCGAREWHDSRAQAAALLYRLSLESGDVGAVAAEGVPENQFSFDSSDGRFRALLARPGDRCLKLDDETPARLALLDIPLSAFGTNVHRLSESAYATVPPIEHGELENRFIGGWLVYGGRTRMSGFEPDDAEQPPVRSTLWTVPLSHPSEPVGIALPHNSLRIERAGSNAVVTGYGGAEGLSLSYVTLGSAPRRAATTLLPGRFESEGRSHSFGAWVRPDGSGLIAIPTSRRERAGRGWSDSESSSLSYVAISPDNSLAHAGYLNPARRRSAAGYRCFVSCVDWYGNSRPIFTGGRIFALMGTDLVEGRFAYGRVSEVGRLDLTGRPAAR